MGVGLGGGNGISKSGAGSRSGGPGEEYDEQAGGQVRRIEEGDRKGVKGAESSEDAGGIVGISVKGLFDKSHVFEKLHVSHLCIMKAVILERRPYVTLMCKSVVNCEFMPKARPSSSSSSVATAESEDRHVAKRVERVELCRFGESRCFEESRCFG